MTAITLEASKGSSVFKFFRRIFKAMIDARQRQVNREIANYLYRNEFRREDRDYIQSMIERGRIDEILENYQSR